MNSPSPFAFTDLDNLSAGEALAGTGMVNTATDADTLRSIHEATPGQLADPNDAFIAYGNLADTLSSLCDALSHVLMWRMAPPVTTLRLLTPVSILTGELRDTTDEQWVLMVQVSGMQVQIAAPFNFPNLIDATFAALNDDNYDDDLAVVGAAARQLLGVATRAAKMAENLTPPF